MGIVFEQIDAVSRANEWKRAGTEGNDGRESQKTAVILLPEMQKPNKQRKNSVNILFLLFTTSLRCRNKHLNTVCGGL